MRMKFYYREIKMKIVYWSGIVKYKENACKSYTEGK